MAERVFAGSFNSQRYEARIKVLLQFEFGQINHA